MSDAQVNRLLTDHPNAIGAAYDRPPADLIVPSTPAAPFWVKITASAVVGPPAELRWKYSWAEIEFVAIVVATGVTGKIQAKSGGRTGAANAFNDLEQINPSATGASKPLGIGVYKADMDIDGDGTPEYSIKAVPNGTPVLLYPQAVRDDEATMHTLYHFAAPNVFTGGCDG